MYVMKLQELDLEYQTVLKNRKQDHILVSHSAFGYLCKRYGLVQLSVTGIAPHQEPTPGTLAKLIEETKAHGIRYIFMETLASPKTVYVLAEEANLQVLTLNPAAGLTEEQIKSNADYFSIMRENLRNLQQALVN